MATFKSIEQLRAIIARNKTGVRIVGDPVEPVAPGTTKAKRQRKPKAQPEQPVVPVRHILTLPMPPSANRYWRNYKGVTVISDEARAYKRDAAEIIKALHVTPAQGPLAAYLVFYFARRGADLDNRIKVALDSMNGLCYIDDKQVDEIHAKRRYDSRRPRVEIVIETVIE